MLLDRAKEKRGNEMQLYGIFVKMRIFFFQIKKFVDIAKQLRIINRRLLINCGIVRIRKQWG